MSRAWEKWYGESLSEPDPLFWANKLHFYISGLSFYNFPYLFGYLFSLGVYAKRLTFGDEFFPRYEGLLRDTGRLTAEDLAASIWTQISRGRIFGATRWALLKPRVDQFENSSANYPCEAYRSTQTVGRRGDLGPVYFVCLFLYRIRRCNDL
ncbi:MAG: hypothetical protein CM1200mP9_06240 [Gammaproteobacteria bacterium]|nr:MAG: hypothetical protein CM1200mP9_06240 [Gammaproteobacteria bacterium]